MLSLFSASTKCLLNFAGMFGLTFSSSAERIETIGCASGGNWALGVAEVAGVAAGSGALPGELSFFGGGGGGVATVVETGFAYAGGGGMVFALKLVFGSC